jgi:hypothetical protein
MDCRDVRVRGEVLKTRAPRIIFSSMTLSMGRPIGPGGL